MLVSSSHLVHQFAKKCRSAGFLLYNEVLYPLSFGYISKTSGNHSTSQVQEYCTLDYVPILGVSEFSISFSNIPTYTDSGVAFYDSNFRFISGVAENPVSYAKILVPDTARYFRFSIFGFSSAKGNLTISKIS